jgi:wyosine [tRNA(Phe)-imidazoG37] synthetase (radical SAM superfamily)
VNEKRKRRFYTCSVRSRRLGRSLGVDLVPFKTCPFDCIYCELGRTTDRTAVPGDYFTAADVLAEIREVLRDAPAPDHIPLVGAGEPTLNRRIGDVIRGVKDISDIPVALITSGSLFWIDEVRQAVSGADLIIPSFDAGTETTFQRINRPHRDITLEKIQSGLRLLRESYSGPLWLEVFLVEDINTSEKELLAIRACAERIAPDRIQLNTVDRTAAEPFVQAVDDERMKQIAAFFGPRCKVIGG